MNENIKNIIRNNLGFIYRPFLTRLRNEKKRRYIKRDTCIVKSLISSSNGKRRIFYLGITCHSNLGDMAQYHCINHWIKDNYPNRYLIEVEANTVVDTRFGFIDFFKRNFQIEDIIIFQSGYTTQDLGGVHDLMHRIVIEALPEAKILMMPQTVFFRKQENKLLSSRIYNQARHMLFLSRDKISHEMACEMFPDIKKDLYPDIVTTLIGQYNFESTRERICICRRNDGEKYYSEESIQQLKSNLEKLYPVDVTDTTLSVNPFELRKNRVKYIEQQIKYFSQYKAVITDRYHGTIFALAAGTPVIIIKTNDHKVVTGADWFRGVYDDYIHVAEDLDDAFSIFIRLNEMHLAHNLHPYFKSKYYDCLKDRFESIW